VIFVFHFDFPGAKRLVFCSVYIFKLLPFTA
jgi:hypothetical protein